MIEGKNITKLFGKNGLKSTDITVKKGEMAALAGASGCGKSTLLNILTGMLRPDSGSVFIKGTDISKLSEKERTALRSGVIGYMMQKNALLPELTVWQNILFLAYTAKKKPDKQKAEEIAERLSLTSLLGSYPSQISGGEYRRAMLARVLVTEPEIIIADEPTSNLDRESAEIVRDMLKEVNKNGITVLAASHDPLLLESADRVIDINFKC
ncbi:ABC transporter ATP-binding protein [Ruminococcus sp. HUN007]|uniref:ABC transporter ATP-binding protein n=1 Tax=Ruminococcus sp. HUN007 TaxID=1514668 RepID=UPI0005D27777|nr:ABC transporter ATP-binding protein [Ruminococcus sp. HUN007]